MPRIPRRRRPERRFCPDASARVLLVLFEGHDFDFIDPALGREINPDLLRRVWTELREDMVTAWVWGLAATGLEMPEREWFQAEPRPGSRPYGWWKYDSPEPRRVVAGVESPKSGFAPWRPGQPRQYWFGVPSTRADNAQYETEFAYIDRLKLWLPNEREAAAERAAG